MKFCPNCGMRLTLAQHKSAFILLCSGCGYREVAKKRTVVSQAPKGVSIAVIGKEEQRLRTLPASKIPCPRCGHKEALWWFVQLRGVDESPTQFFRCTKCGYTWREVT